MAKIALATNYESTRLGRDFQKTLNCYPHTKRGYRQFPGLVEFGNFLSETEALNDSAADPLIASDGALTVSIESGGIDRGLHVMDGVLYVVSGPSLYSVNSLGAGTYLDAIAGTGPVVMSSNGGKLVISAGANSYQYTTGGGLVEITDVDLSTNYTNAYIDSRFVFDQPSGQFVVSEINDPTDINALDFATAEAFSDDILRVFALNRLVYLFGAESTEMWYTSGVGRPPLDRQGVLQHGIVGRYAVSAIDDTIYFIDDKRRPHIMEGSAHRPLVVSSAIGEAWDSYSPATMDDARVQCYALEQENFIDFIFPLAGDVWTYHEPSGSWFEKTFKTTSIVRVYDKTIAADYDSKLLYALDFNTYTNNGEAMQRVKDTQLINIETFGGAGKDIILMTLRPHVDTSAEAEIDVSVTKDFSTYGTARTITATGNQTRELPVWGKCREAVIRLDTTANARVDFLDLEAEIEALNG